MALQRSISLGILLIISQLQWTFLNNNYCQLISGRAKEGVSTTEDGRKTEHSSALDLSTRAGVKHSVPGGAKRKKGKKARNNAHKVCKQVWFLDIGHQQSMLYCISVLSSH